MRKILFLTVLVAVITNAYSQSNIKVPGSRPKAGDVIHGVVRNTDGPMESVLILESGNEELGIIPQGMSDKNGHFSFELEDTKDYIELRAAGYYTAKKRISNNQYEILLKRDPDIDLDSIRISWDTERKSRADVKNANNCPLLVLDDKIMIADSIKWKEIGLKNTTFSKAKIAYLYGIETNTIKKIVVLDEVAARELWGNTHGKFGSIIIRTK